MINCNECGNELRETAKFCVHCGAKVDQATKISTDKVELENQTSALEVEETTDELSESTLDMVEYYVFDYIDFIKETLINPSSIFSKENEVWIFGAVNLILYSVALTINSYESFFTTFLKFVVLQAIFPGILFLINKFILKGKDTFLDAVGKYGGLVSGQILLFLLLKIFGIDSGLGSLLFLVSLMNQLLIFNLYVFKSQTNAKGKFDNYYQLIISYIPLIIVMSFMFKDI